MSLGGVVSFVFFLSSSFWMDGKGEEEREREGKGNSPLLKIALILLTCAAVPETL
jgi:hypothetical protein